MELTRRGFSPLRSNGVKLAAEKYDPDDGLVRQSPPLERQIVNLRPSPSPDYLPPPERSPTPERLSRLSNSRGRPRRPKAQASQGDAVLIGFLGGLNHPDLAIKAGEEPLPQSDSDDESMEIDEDEQTSREPSDPVQLAKNAVSMVERGDRRSEDPHGSSKNENARPAFLKIQTQTEPPISKNGVNGDSEIQQDPSLRASQPAVNGIPRPDENGSKTSHSPSRSKSPANGDSDSATLSPMVRRYTIPNSERPTEALPAMPPLLAPNTARAIAGRFTVKSISIPDEQRNSQFIPDERHSTEACSVPRHVRVNHAEKDTNDPQLREVLAQRCEGGNRGRRRRLGSG
ncbi:hypothetical protein OEA41_000919 [Lepraria neglecta]|uniref:Uncharacterized protein n=1 Tax=Lepraria neglecta TaxID=209136 RepID=A0AAE0DQ91_9LECA|nr:hypothetical protein OEA41_000919 [Lepraria neglecta]